MNLEKFFAEYQARVDKALGQPPEVDVEAMAAAFADCFIGATPRGLMCGENDDELREWIPKGMAFYRSVGTKSMKIGSLATTPLDQFHTMAKVHWVAHYEKKDGSEVSIEFDAIYLVRHLDGTPKIFAWITGDEMALLKANGLLPE